MIILMFNTKFGNGIVTPSSSWEYGLLDLGFLNCSFTKPFPPKIWARKLNKIIHIKLNIWPRKEIYDSKHNHMTQKRI